MMNFRERLIEKIKQKQSVVCMGIDPDTTSEQFPNQLFFYESKPKLEFAKMLIDETHDLIPVIKEPLPALGSIINSSGFICIYFLTRFKHNSTTISFV